MTTVLTIRSLAIQHPHRPQFRAQLANFFHPNTLTYLAISIHCLALMLNCPSRLEGGDS